MVENGISEADELEAMIVSKAAAPSHGNLSLKENFPRIWKQLVVVFMLILFAGVGFYREEVFTSSVTKEVQEMEEIEDKHPGLSYHPKKKKEKSKDVIDNDSDEDEPDDENEISSNPTSESETNLPIDTSEIVASAIKKLEKAHEDIIVNEIGPLYGNFTDTFFAKSVVDKIVSSYSNSSKEMLKTRLKIKFIQSQIGEKKASSFTWITAGHSSAAGHGNLFNQTYTAVLEQTMQKVFQLVNIDFKAKNYAMGGTSSGPELALCMDAVFGLDMDMLSWDFGMTDGNRNWLWELWIQRAGIHRSRPILIEPTNPRHAGINKRMEQHAMSIFTIDKNRFWTFIPDSQDNPALDSLPPNIRYYRCQREIENEALCQPYKYDTPQCPNAKFKASWHWGWKEHGTIGRYLSLFLLKFLQEAISELDPKSEASLSRSMLRKMQENKNNNMEDMEQAEPSVSQEYLDLLLQSESMNKIKFLASSRPDDIGEGENIGASNFTFFQREKAICHFAQLPSQARYDGLVTNSDIKGKYQFSGLHSDYDTGDEVAILTRMSIPGTMRPLKVAYFKGERQNCETPLQIDYKDAFYVDASFGWTGTIVPNEASKRAFLSDEDPIERKGLVMMCNRKCDWGQCPTNFLQISDVNKNMTIAVNDVAVTGTVLFDDHCFVISNMNGYFFPPHSNPDLKGQYEIKIKVDEGPGYLHLTSIIIV